MPARTPFASGAGAELAQVALRKIKNSARKKRETRPEKAARAMALADRLTALYGDVACPLTHHNTFELLIAVILSAQCTDAAVNKVTPALFQRYPDPAALAAAPLAEIESRIRTLGLFRAKAKSLKRCAAQLARDFSGAVPSAMDELTRLAGVGRKTANVIRGHAFAIPGIAVDTHCGRLARRLGLSRQQNPAKVENDLARLLPPMEWTGFSHRLIVHGRRVCSARQPACGSCALSELCPSKV